RFVLPVGALDPCPLPGSPVDDEATAVGVQLLDSGHVEHHRCAGGLPHPFESGTVRFGTLPEHAPHPAEDAVAGVIDYEPSEVLRRTERLDDAGLTLRALVELEARDASDRGVVDLTLHTRVTMPEKPDADRVDTYLPKHRVERQDHGPSIGYRR